MVRTHSTIVAAMPRPVPWKSLVLTGTATPSMNSSANSLHSDYINPVDLCNRLNAYIVPEALVHLFLTSLFLINGYWLALLLNVPLVAFNGKKYVDLGKSLAAQLLTKLYHRYFENRHLLDATEIFRKLNIHKKVPFSVAS